MVTVTNPVVAPAGTIAVIAKAVSPVIVATVPLNVTDVAPLRFVPDIVTAVPAGPVAGARPLIVGGCTTVKLAAVVYGPPGVVIEMGPVVAPLGTTTWI